jgi:selenocysteine-specific elongation factor
VTFEKGTLSEKIAVKVKRSGIHGITVLIIEGWIKAEIPSIREAIRELKGKGILIQVDDMLIHKTAFDSFREKTKKLLDDFHKKNPLKPGMLKEELRAKLALEPRLFSHLVSSLKDIVLDKELVRLSTFKAALSGGDETVQTRILDLLEKAGFQPPTKEELSQSLKIDQKRFADILKLMSKEGSLIRINESVYLTSTTYKQMIENLRSFFSRKPDMTVAEFRDVLQTSRKYALPFLEYLDSNKITMRVGDVRKLLLK